MTTLKNIPSEDWQNDFQQHLKSLSSAIDSVASIRAYLEQGDSLLEFAFRNQADIALLLKAKTNLIDKLLINLWQSMHPEGDTQASIIAVGGYGRKEMHPRSDVDILILLSNDIDSDYEAFLSAFVTHLWDIGLDLGHSVRTLEECATEAKNDLTVITNLIESRFLQGDKSLYYSLKDSISPRHMWDSPTFFTGKIDEQVQRYKRYGDTAYRVEPNLKEGPGGLRDIHTIYWVTQRHYGTLSLEQLHDSNVLTSEEYSTVIESRDFLWKVRFALHITAGRKEERLLLDYQKPLAALFGYSAGQHSNKDVEDFMQAYYRTITTMERFNEMLIAMLKERILGASKKAVVKIGEHYFSQGNEIGISNNHTFAEHPHTLLEIFHVLQTTPKTKGLTANTIRSIQHHLPLIDNAYRLNSQHKQIFMSIMAQPRRITFIMRRMNRYGVMAAWLPMFGNIVGRMQFDLFHAYTVDEHTLKVISNLRRFSTQKGMKELPHCSLIFKTLPDHRLLYLAGLFHDIAKGRDGDHSTLGAVDAYQFCHSHGLDSFQSNMVSWLVRYHLLMSTTAQRKDISDPVVIHEFANQVVEHSRLDYLYLLTIADIKGTNPELLTSWKYMLIKELYDKTKNLLLYGMPPASYNELVEQKTVAVLEQLPTEFMSKEQGWQYCESMGYEYLVQHKVETIMWHMGYIVNKHETPIVHIRHDQLMGSNQIFIYTPRGESIFTRVVSAMERLKLNIVAASLLVLDNDHVLSTLNFLDTQQDVLHDSSDQSFIIKTMQKYLSEENFTFEHDKHYRTPRKLKNFDVKTHIHFSQDRERKQTLLTIRTGDRPGLLSLLSEAFTQQGIRISNARISTLGEVAEDIFNVVTPDDQPILDKTKQTEIKKAILTILKQHDH